MSATSRKAPARKPAQRPPIIAKAQPKPVAKASTRSGNGGPGVHVSNRVEFTLIRIGNVFNRSKTVNRAARGKGAGGFFARMLQRGSKALTQGAISGAKAAGIGHESTPEGAESWRRFQQSHPGSVHGSPTPSAPTPAQATAGSGALHTNQRGGHYVCPDCQGSPIDCSTCGGVGYTKGKK